MGRLEGWQLIIIIVLALLLFGAPKLPGLARSMGQSLRIFKSEVRQMKDDDKPDTAAEPPVEGRIVNDIRTPGTTPGATATPPGQATGTDQRNGANPPTP